MQIIYTILTILTIILFLLLIVILFLILDFIINGIKNGGDDLWLNYFLGNLRKEHPYYYNTTNSMRSL